MKEMVPPPPFRMLLSETRSALKFKAARFSLQFQINYYKNKVKCMGKKYGFSNTGQCCQAWVDIFAQRANRWPKFFFFSHHVYPCFIKLFISQDTTFACFRSVCEVGGKKRLLLALSRLSVLSVESLCPNAAQLGFVWTVFIPPHWKFYIACLTNTSFEKILKSEINRHCSSRYVYIFFLVFCLLALTCLPFIV